MARVTHMLSQERKDLANIETCLTLNNIDIRETPSMATIYKSALLPLHNLSCGGTVYKSGNEVTVLLQGDEEVVMKIIHRFIFFVLKNSTFPLQVVTDIKEAMLPMVKY